MAEQSQTEKSSNFSRAPQRPERKPIGSCGIGRTWQNEPELKVGSIFNASGEPRMRGMAEQSQIEKSNDFSAGDQRPEGRPVGDVGPTKWQNKAKPKRAAISVGRRNGRSESQSGHAGSGGHGRTNPN